MKHTFTQLREVVTSVHRLVVDGLSITKSTIRDDADRCFSSRCIVDGDDCWEIRFHPALYYVHGHCYCPGLELVFLGETRTGVTATLSARIIGGGSHDEFVAFKEGTTEPREFHRPLDRSLPLYIGVGRAKEVEDDFDSCSLTVECTITVFREPQAAEGVVAAVPSSNLNQHLGELLESQAGADVTFAMSGGESIAAAHKSVVAARSPVFKVEFFGGTQQEKTTSGRVEIKDMDAAAFTAMLRFIYTDAVPELEARPEAATTALAQRLLAAADRYGLDRLKVLCERRLALGMDAGTVASTLALAEQRNFSRLKARCVDFIAGGSPECLDAVLATEGYKQLAASSPSVLTDILKAAHGRINSQHQSTQAAAGRHELKPRHTCTQVSEGVESVYLLKIDGFAVTKATIGNSNNCIKSRCTVDGCDLEIRFNAANRRHQDVYLVDLELAFLGGACAHGVEASLRGRLVEHQSSGVAPTRGSKQVSKTFKHPPDCTFPIFIGRGIARDSQPPGVLAVECTVTVFRDLKGIRPPASDLHKDLRKLLRSRSGADVTFTVSGESFAAHKSVLAARSPVFKAEFFGEMEEKASRRVEIRDMDAQVFKALLRFIYTDMVPDEFVNQSAEAVEEGTVMAQHLLVAADRYGLDRLKAMSEQRLSLGMGVGTVASTLALAEQFNCSHLKAKSIEFISGGSSKELDTVLETEGYRHLEASSPSVLTELLKAAHRNKRRRSTEDS